MPLFLFIHQSSSFLLSLFHHQFLSLSHYYLFTIVIVIILIDHYPFPSFPQPPSFTILFFKILNNHFIKHAFNLFLPFQSKAPLPSLEFISDFPQIILSNLLVLPLSRLNPNLTCHSLFPYLKIYYPK